MNAPKATASRVQIPPVVTEIGNRATLKAMNLVRSSCEVVGTLRPGEAIQDLNVELRGGGARHPAEARTIVCSFGADIAARGPEPEKTIIARFACDYAVQYEFQDEEFFRGLSDNDLNLFAAFNTSLHVWPHMREFVQSMAFRMTVPPVLLPMFRPLDLIGPQDRWREVAAKPS